MKAQDGSPAGAGAGAEDGAEPGELERMTDEEYAAYVRARMFEKTHQHVLEERRRREEIREREKEKRRGRGRGRRGLDEEAEEYEELRRRIEESLRRGRERKVGGEREREMEKWKRAWRRYCERWEELGVGAGVGASSNGLKPNQQTHDEEQLNSSKRKQNLRDTLPWPVHSGKWKDVSRQEIETFYRNASLQVSGANKKDADADADAALMTLLKAERVRWHPDKVLHRFGGDEAVDAKTMERVTVVFQVIDGMRSEGRRDAHG